MYYDSDECNVPKSIDSNDDLEVILNWLGEHFPTNKYSLTVHGVAHACRTAFLVRVLYNFYHKFDTRTDLLDDKTLKMLQIVAAFHDAGREGDGPDNKKWEEKGAELAEQFLTDLCYEDKALSHLLSLTIVYKDQKISFDYDFISKNNIELLKSPQENLTNEEYTEQLFFLCRDLLHDADCLEILRIFGANTNGFDKSKLTCADDNMVSESDTLQDLLDKIIAAHKAFLSTENQGEYQTGNNKDKIAAYSKVATAMCKGYPQEISEFYDAFLEVPVIEINDDKEKLRVLTPVVGNYLLQSAIGTNDLSPEQKLPYSDTYTQERLDAYDLVRSPYDIAAYRGDKRPPEEITRNGFCSYRLKFSGNELRDEKDPETLEKNEIPAPLVPQSGFQIGDSALVYVTLSAKVATSFGKDKYVYLVKVVGGLQPKDILTNKEKPLDDSYVLIVGMAPPEDVLAYYDIENKKIYVRKHFAATRYTVNVETLLNCLLPQDMAIDMETLKQGMDPALFSKNEDDLYRRMTEKQKKFFKQVEQGIKDIKKLGIIIALFRQAEIPIPENSHRVRRELAGRTIFAADLLVALSINGDLCKKLLTVGIFEKDGTPNATGIDRASVNTAQEDFDSKVRETLQKVFKSTPKYTWSQLFSKLKNSDIGKVFAHPFNLCEFFVSDGSNIALVAQFNWRACLECVNENFNDLIQRDDIKQNLVFLLKEIPENKRLDTLKKWRDDYELTLFGGKGIIEDGRHLYPLLGAYPEKDRLRILEEWQSSDELILFGKKGIIKNGLNLNNLLRAFPENERSDFLKKWIDDYGLILFGKNGIVKHRNDLANLLLAFPRRDRLKLLTKCRDDYRLILFGESGIIKNGSDLAYLLIAFHGMWLSDVLIKLQDTYELILFGKKGIIKDGLDLENLLRKFFANERFSLLGKWRKDNLIFSGKDSFVIEQWSDLYYLLNAFRENKDNQIKFLKFLWESDDSARYNKYEIENYIDELVKLMEDEGTESSSIRTSEKLENKCRNFFGSDKFSIKTYDDLIFLLKIFPLYHRMFFLDFLINKRNQTLFGEDGIVKNASNLASLLEALLECNRPYYLNDFKRHNGLILFGEKGIIKNASDLASLLKAFPECDLSDHLDSFKGGNLILFGEKGIVKDVSDLASLLKAFPECDRSYRLNDFKRSNGLILFGEKGIIKNASDLASLLKAFPECDRSDHLDSFKGGNLILFGEKGIVKDVSDLASLLTAFPEKNRLGIIKTWRKNDIIFRNKNPFTTKTWNGLFFMSKESRRAIFSSRSSLVIETTNDLVILLRIFYSREDEIGFLKLLRKDPNIILFGEKGIIKKAENLVELLEKNLKKKRISFLKFFEEEQDLILLGKNGIIKTENDFVNFLCKFDENEQSNFIKFLEKKYGVILLREKDEKNNGRKLDGDYYTFFTIVSSKQQTDKNQHCPIQDESKIGSKLI